LAKEAFITSVSKIEFNLAKENKTRIVEGVLFITIDTSKVFRSFPNAIQLQEQIEAHL